MDEENGAEITALDASAVLIDGDTSAIVVELPEEENAPEVQLSDAVAIAAIESETQIALAEIHTEAATEQTALMIEAEAQRENSWQLEAEILRTNLGELTETIADLSLVVQTLLTPQVSTEAAEVLETEAPNNLTPEFTSEPTSETQTEVIPESADEKPGAELLPILPRRKRRPI